MDVFVGTPAVARRRKEAYLEGRLSWGMVREAE